MSLVGFKARNHPQQTRRDHVDDRCVLPEFFEPLHARYKFTVDAAASEGNHVLPRYWTAESNGLAQPWKGERVWCNPPFSSIAHWVAKASLEAFSGDCELIVMLLPANRCEQSWWQKFVEPVRDKPARIELRTRFLAGRMRFAHPGEWTTPAKGDRPPFGCVLLTWSIA